MKMWSIIKAEEVWALFHYTVLFLCVIKPVSSSRARIVRFYRRHLGEVNLSKQYQQHLGRVNSSYEYGSYRRVQRQKREYIGPFKTIKQKGDKRTWIEWKQVEED